MKEYLNPKESLEGKAKDALEAEALWDAKCLEDFSIMNVMHSSSLLNALDNSYVALAVFTRFRRKLDDVETLKDVKIFYKNFKKAIAEKEYLSGEGILRFARTAYVVWSSFVNDRKIAYSPEEMKELGLDDDRLKQQIFYNVTPSVMGVNSKVFDGSIRPMLASFNLREKIVFDKEESLVKLIEKLTLQ